MSTARFVLAPRGEFSLAKAVRFLQGFVPLSGRDGDEPDEVLRLAFCADGDWRPIAVRVRQSVAGRVTATVEGPGELERVRAQIERLLSIDVDASMLEDVVAGDLVAAELVARFRGLRPVCFASPYEAACWAVLSQRIRTTQAVNIRRRMCFELGTVFELDGVRVAAFPAPDELLRTNSVQGLPQVKVERLHGVATAALERRLDAAALRAAGPQQALADLQRLPGIGPFGAELVLIRGAGEPDHFARSERRLHAAIGAAYGVAADDVDALESIASRWSPFRSWIGFLFRVAADYAGR